MAGVEELGRRDDRKRDRRRAASLPETAIVRDDFVARLRSGRDMATVADTPRLEDVLGPLRVARQRTAVLQVFLLHPLDRTTGAARVSSQAALASPARLLSLLKGDLFITTAGAQDGLALSAITRHLSSSEDRTEYSLALWGIFVR